MLKRFIAIDTDLCTGCRNCELACSIRNTGTFNPRQSRIQVLKREAQNLILPVVCLQCEEPLCEEACPSHAIRLNDAGVLTVKEDVCIGCQNCVTACVYGGVEIDPITKKAIKCDLCGGDPACVDACEYGAISVVERTEEGLRTRLVGMKRAARQIGIEMEEA